MTVPRAVRTLEQARLCPKDVKAEQAVLDLTDPFLTPPQATHPHPGFLQQGSSMRFFLLTVSIAEIHVPRRRVVLLGVREMRVG